MRRLLLKGRPYVRRVGNFACSIEQLVRPLKRVRKLNPKRRARGAGIDEGSADRQIRILSACSLTMSHGSPKEQRTNNTVCLVESFHL